MDGVHQEMIVAPLGWSTCPLMYEASSLARKTKLGATSLGWPARFIGALAAFGFSADPGLPISRDCALNFQAATKIAG